MLYWLIKRPEWPVETLPAQEETKIELKFKNLSFSSMSRPNLRQKRTKTWEKNKRKENTIFTVKLQWEMGNPCFLIILVSKKDQRVHLEEKSRFDSEILEKGWRVKVGHIMSKNWILHHCSYSIFITVTLPHADICDLWATGCQPRSDGVCVCVTIYLMNSCVWGCVSVWGKVSEGGGPRGWMQLCAHWKLIYQNNDRHSFTLTRDQPPSG